MCSRSSCTSCSKLVDCGWCATSNAVAVGDCISISEAATSCAGQSLVSDEDQCPSVGADVILKNITGMLGALIGVAIILNVYNRVSNRRRRKKLQHSIFKLPVYVYTTSSRKRARAAREALLQAQGAQASSDPTHDAEGAGCARAATSSESSSSSEDGDDDASVMTCAVCLAAYEEEEVIKVLPCGHDFHADCLDCWLEQKATCPLCTAPAFTKSRDQDRPSHGQPSIQGHRQADVAPPLFRPSDQAQSSQVGDASSGGGVHGGLLLARPASPAPPETNGEAGVDAALRLREARPREGSETALREKEEGVTAVPAIAMAMVLEGEGTGVQNDGAAREETATTGSAEDGRPLTSGGAASAPPIGPAVVATNIRVGAWGGASSAGGVAGDGGGEGPAGVTYPSEVVPPCHGGNLDDAARPRVTPGTADWEVSLTDLERGHAKDGADVAADAVEVVADGGIVVGHDESGLAGGGGVDVEGGRSGVDRNVGGVAVAF